MVDFTWQRLKNKKQQQKTHKNPPAVKFLDLIFRNNFFYLQF